MTARRIIQNHEGREPRRGRAGARGQPGHRQDHEQGLVEERGLLSSVSAEFHGFGWQWRRRPER